MGVMTDDMALLDRYVRHHSEEAFAALVSRHVNLVYSVALRQVGEAPLAEEITQAVFVILARKARSLSSRTILSGWLCRTARYVSANALTVQRRRRKREEAYMQSVLNEPEPETWTQMAPLLDAGLEQLGGKDHDALVLRYFDNRSLSEVGALLDTSEGAAKKRVSRALEKLRKFFAMRGIISTTAIIAGAVSANSVQAAPTALAKSVTTVAVAKGAVASGSTLSLIKGALKLMAWTKAKTAIVAGAAILIAAGTTTVIVKKATPSTPASIYKTIFAHPSSQSMNLLESAPPTLIFRPTQFPQKGGSGFWTRTGKSVAVDYPLRTLFGIAYGFSYARVVFPDDFNLENTNYDILITLPDHQNEALQEALKKRFGLTAHAETRDTDVLLLKVADPAKLQLHKTKGGGYRNYQAGDRQIFRNAGLAVVADYVEVDKPVFDGTGTKEHFDLSFRWPEPKRITTAGMSALQDFWSKQLNQLGLELVPANMPVKMLVVEKAEN